MHCCTSAAAAAEPISAVQEIGFIGISVLAEGAGLEAVAIVSGLSADC